MKKIGFIIIGVLAVLLVFIIYKFVILQKYKVESVSINNDTIFNETIDIKYNQIDDSITFDEMSYYDYFIDYVNKENTNFKVKYDDNGEISSFYTILKEKQYIHMLNANSFSLEIENTNYYTEEDMKKYLSDNNINDDIDLLKYIKENYYLNTSIFNSSKKMKYNYIINTFVQVTLPEFESITLINGDKLRGYIINTTNIKEIHLLNKDNQYIITLSGNEITNSKFIKELLETISFN